MSDAVGIVLGHGLMQRSRGYVYTVGVWYLTYYSKSRCEVNLLGRMLKCVVHMLMVSEGGAMLGIWMVWKVAYGTIVRRWLRIV